MKKIDLQPVVLQPSGTPVLSLEFPAFAGETIAIHAGSAAAGLLLYPGSRLGCVGEVIFTGSKIDPVCAI